NSCIEHIDEHYGLDYLNLSDCAIEDKDIQFINAFTEKHHIEWLDLRNNKITAAGAAELSNNKTIRSLDISLNAIKDQGAIDLAKNMTLSGLHVIATQIG